VHTPYCLVCYIPCAGNPSLHLLLLLLLVLQRTEDMRVTADLTDVDEQRPGWTEQQAAEAAAEAAQAGLHELDSPRSSEGASLTAATVDGESEAGSPSRIPSLAAAGSSSGAGA
jgi:hypothetical protein